MVGLNTTISKSVWALALGASLGACGQLETRSLAYGPDTVTVARSAADDRLMYYGQRQSPDEPKPNVVCAAPSPDAIQASAFAASASGGDGKINAGGALAMSQTAAYVGMRTQTIQLLRDGYYRLCEAYLNGAMSSEQYNLHFTNMPQVLALLLTIDTVAGAAVPPPVIAGQQASATPAGQPAVQAGGAQAAHGVINRGPGVGANGEKILAASMEAAADRSLTGFCAMLIVDLETWPADLNSPRAKMISKCIEVVGSMGNNRASAATKMPAKSAKASAKKRT